MSNGEGQDMAATGEYKGMSEVGFKATERVGQERVVLRGVQVIVLDDLPTGTRNAALDAIGAVASDFIRTAWTVESKALGSFDAAVEAHAGRSGEEGNKPGRYRAVRKAAWLEKGPRVIEPPLA